MEYLLLTIIISLWLFWLNAKKMRQQLLFRLLEKKLLSRQKSGAWYASDVVRDIAKKLDVLSKQKIIRILEEISESKYDELKSYVSPVEVKSIKAMFLNKCPSLTVWQKAEKSVIDFEIDKVARILEKLQPKNRYEKAKFDYLSAIVALKEGDLQDASLLATRAASSFKKLFCFYEEGCAYLLSGSVYRACGSFDTAMLMLQTAKNLFDECRAFAKKAETAATQGMLMVAEERFEEAYDYFAEAKSIYSKIQDSDGEASVLNQKALMKLLQNQTEEANDLTREAMNILKKSKNIRLLALSYDLKAQISAKQKKWKTVIKSASDAEELYQKTKNIPAELEIMLLKAQALIEQNKSQKAELLLRSLLEKAKQQKTCFHIANVYSLLGLLYLRKKEYKRAEALFMQSLNSEVCNERWAGAAIDCANIALSKRKRGKGESAEQDYKQALQYAEESGNSELLELLKETQSIN